MDPRDPRQARFYLRFESGDRQGDRVPLPDGVTRVGRRSSNHLPLNDGSVSGRHAEVRVSGGVARLVDLKSTNGTRVEGQRVEEQDLAHGDVIHFGSLRFTFVDQLLDSEPTLEPAADVPEPDAAASLATGEGGGLATISAERVARAGRRSVWVLVVLATAAAGAGYLLWRIGLEGSDAVVAAPVAEVEGNLLADGSFEGEDAAWIPGPGATELAAGRAYASTGRRGLGGDLADGEWAVSRSPSFRLEARRALSAGARVWAERGARVVLGVELEGDGEQAPDFTAWSPARSRTDGFEEVELSFDALPGYGSARLVVVAWSEGEGTVSIDDAHAVAGGSGAGSKSEFNEYEARVLGAPGATAVLLRSGRVVFPGVSFFHLGEGGPQGFAEAVFDVAERETGLAFRVSGAPDEAAIRVPVNVTRREGGEEESGWVSSLGTGGYRSHASELSETGVTTLLLGRGLDLLSIDLERPTKVTGRVVDEVLGLELAIGSSGGFDVKLTFGDERAQASRLRRLAQDETRAGRPGRALEAWEELLDKYPYEAELVREAETGRSTLIQEGLEQVASLRNEVDRARFFGLVELFRDVQGRALDLANGYSGSEVEQEARSLARTIDDEIAAVRGDASDGGSRRSVIAQVLEREGAPNLAEHVRESLSEARTPAVAGEDR